MCNHVNVWMLRYVHQLVSNCVCLLFGAEQIVYSVCFLCQLLFLSELVSTTDTFHMIWSLINIKYWVVQFHTLNLKPTLRKYFTLVVFLSLMKVMTQFPKVHCDCLLTEWVWEETGAPGENPQTHRENEQTSCRLDVDAVFILVAGGSHWKSDLKMWLLDFLMSWPHHAGVDHLVDKVLTCVRSVKVFIFLNIFWSKHGAGRCDLSTQTYTKTAPQLSGEFTWSWSQWIVKISENVSPCTFVSPPITYSTSDSR